METISNRLVRRGRNEVLWQGRSLFRSRPVATFTIGVPVSQHEVICDWLNENNYYFKYE